MTYKDLLKKFKVVEDQKVVQDDIFLLEELSQEQLDAEMDKAAAGLMVAGLQENAIAYFQAVEKMIVSLAEDVGFDLVEYELKAKG